MQKKVDFQSQPAIVVKVENISSYAKTRDAFIEQQLAKPVETLPAWKSTEMGFIPNPTTPKSEFMNSILPEFYNSKFKHCSNVDHFVNEFHKTGEQLYRYQRSIDDSDKQICFIIDKEAALLHKDHTLIRSDKNIICKNIRKAKNIMSSVNATKMQITFSDSTLFTSTGELKCGENAAHTLFKKQLESIAVLCRKVKHVKNQLSELNKKCTGLFKSKRRKRQLKQNKNKSK